MRISWYRALPAFAWALSAPIAITAEVPACYRDLEVNFFRSNLVNEALSLHAISQSNWNLINTDLQRNVKRVPEMIRERAKKMDPNPFGAPFQPREASDLMQQVLLEVFSETLSVFHITNQNKIEEMFQYIRERQSQRLVFCFGEEKDQKHN